MNFCKRYLLFGLLMCLVLAGMTYVFAADRTMTLKSGQSYEIHKVTTGNNANTEELKFSLVGKGNYEWSTADTTGHFYNFGTSSGGPVLNKDTIVYALTITSAEDVVLSYPEEWEKFFELKNRSNPTLKTITLLNGQHYEMHRNTNGSSDKIELLRFTMVGKGSFEWSNADTSGHFTRCGTSTGAPELNNTTMIHGFTITGDNDLVLRYPYEWDKLFELKTRSNPVIQSVTLSKGQNYDIKALFGEEEKRFTKLVISHVSGNYHWSTYRLDGSLKDYGNNSSGSPEIDRGVSRHGVSVTDDADLVLRMPFEWGKLIEFVDRDTPVLYVGRMVSGESITFINLDADNEYSIHRPDLTYYDVISRHANGKIGIIATDVYGWRMDIHIYKGGTTHITAGREMKMNLSGLTALNETTFVFWFPYDWYQSKILVEKRFTPTLFRYTMTPERSYEVFSLDQDNEHFIYEYTFDYGMFGGNTRTIRVDTGETVYITANSKPLNRLFMPFEAYGNDILVFDTVTDELIVPFATIKRNSDPGASYDAPKERLSQINDQATAVSAVTYATYIMSEEQKESILGVDKVLQFSDEAISRSAQTDVKGKTVTVTAQMVKPLITLAESSKNSVEKALLQDGVTLNKNLKSGVYIDASTENELTIVLDESLATIAVDQISVVGADFAVIIPRDVLQQTITAKRIEIKVAKASTPRLSSLSPLTTLSANPVDFHSWISLQAIEEGRGYNISMNVPLDTNVTVALPSIGDDTDRQAVRRADGVLLGGKHNPLNDTIEFKLNDSATVAVVANSKDFSDIRYKSLEMQEAISVLAAKGIIGGTSETTFSPDASISRAEIAALICRTLSKNDGDGNGGFADVPIEAWYYHVAGAAKKHGIIGGYEDNTFRGGVVIPKQQILAIACRVLRNEMGYRDVNSVEEYLRRYNDRASFADWVLWDLAFATRENLIVQRTDRNLLPESDMTRGDAAIVLKRLFDKIW